MKAASDLGLKARFASYWLDQPGNLANAGATADGHYNQSSFYPTPTARHRAKFAEDFKAHAGAYPINVQGHTTHGIWEIGEALKALNGKPNDKVSVKALESPWRR